MKKIVSLILAFILVFSLASCSVIEGLIPDNDNPDVDDTPADDDGKDDNTDVGGGSDNTGGGTTGGGNSGGSDNPSGDDSTGDDKVDPPTCTDGCKDADGDAICDNCGEGVPVPPEERAPVIFLAGDSTVKTYEENQYIAGWGQFLEYFLGDDIVVKNAAHGGRSSRSFINEGRLYDIEGSDYTFSQNGGNSIADEIKAGDYLFIQFGHNDDDTKKASSYGTMYDRMTPLGTPDANGIYPTTPAEKRATDYLPEAYINLASDSEESTALSTIAKYGDEYYAYGDGSFKWYLKQYIDFARSVGAIPVLVTPVARVKFSGKEIVGGAGLHGDNFAYVEAVRQLASEENCLLIDLFAESKEMLETATSTYANYLMALKPNELTGSWPIGYDATYGNTAEGYTGIEATHYNKYGAFLQAAAVAEAILANAQAYSFSDKVLTAPEKFIDPSNLMSKSTAGLIEALFTTVNVTNPDRWYAQPEEIISKINELDTMGEITSDNYKEIGEMCEQIRLAYNGLNVDYRSQVTNLAKLEAAEATVKAFEIINRPKPTKTVIFDADDLALYKYTETVTEGEFTLVATEAKAMDKKSSKVNFTYGTVSYENTYGLSVGGKATFGSNRYISFTVDGPCTVTVAVRSSGSDVRTLALVDSAKQTVGSFEAPTSVLVSSLDIEEAGTYSVGSAGSGMYIYMIIIEYFE